MHFIRSVHHHRILITRRTPAVKLYVVLVSMRPVDVQVVCRDVERLKTTPREELHHFASCSFLSLIETCALCNCKH